MTRFAVAFLMVGWMASAQVGIGTTNPSPSSILQLESTNKTFVPPRMTNEQMLAIAAPLNGSMVYNTTHNAMFVRTSNGWKNFFETSNASVVLNRVFTAGNAQVLTTNNNYTNFPLSAANAMTVDNGIYSIIGNGRIRVAESGVYMVTGSFSVTNMPAGVRKYIIAVYQNSVLIGYLTRGTANLETTDEWGTSGSLSIAANPNDIIELKYVLNNNGTPLDARIFNMGMTKLK